MSDIRIIATASGKGGTGKSTVALALADLLAQMRPDLDIALLDFDPQASVTGFVGQRQVPNPTKAPAVEMHGFQFYRGGRALFSASEGEIRSFVDGVLAESPNRIVVVDLPPALNATTHSVIMDHENTLVLLVVSTEPSSIQPMMETIALAKAKGRPHFVLLNKHDRRRAPEKGMVLATRGAVGDNLIETVVPVESVVMGSVADQAPVSRVKRGARSKFIEALRAVIVDLFGEAPVGAEG